MTEDQTENTKQAQQQADEPLAKTDDISKFLHSGFPTKYTIQSSIPLRSIDLRKLDG